MPLFRRLPTATRLAVTPLDDRIVPATVLNFNDSGAGSLRDAIAGAAAGDTIDFAPGLGVGTISLTSGALVIDKSLTIQGPGSSALTLDAGGDSRVFELYDATGVADVVISGVTITGGAAASGSDGGGVFNAGERLTLTEVVVTGNAADNGGGVYSIGLYSSLTVTDSTVSGNEAKYDGGGVAVNDATYGSVTFARTTFSGNTAGDDGGGFEVERLYGTLVIDDCQITGNTAGDDGGGGYLHYLASCGCDLVVDITGTTVSDNVAGDRGGGLGIEGIAGAVRIDGSTVADNTAGDDPDADHRDGGGLFLDDIGFGGRTRGNPRGPDVGPADPLTITDTVVSGNVAEYGGGIAIYDVIGTTLIENCSITGNTAAGGGGIYFDNPYYLATIRGTLIAENSAGYNGGGIYVDEPDAGFVIERSVIRDNDALYDGGGLFVYSVDGTDPDGFGFVLRDSTVSGNTAGRDGGGVYKNDSVFAGTFLVQGVTVSGNEATDGGGLFLYDGTDVEIVNSTVTGNTATRSGGGIYLYDGTVTVVSTILSGNTADDEPDDLYLYDGAAADVSFSLVGAVSGSGTFTDEGGNLLNVTDPMLGDLADNGGFAVGVPGATETVRTRLPLAGSPALNAGSNPAMLDSDQRGDGFPRVVGSGTDIGAVEAPDPAAVLVAVRPVLANGNVVDVNLLTWPAGRPLPWLVVGFEAEYSEAVTPTADQTVVGGGPSGTRLRWDAPTTPTSVTLVAATAAGVEDAAGNPGLSNPLAGDITFGVRVGDVNGDGRVTTADLAQVSLAIRTGYNPRADIDGDGDVDQADFNLVRSRLGR